MEQTPKAAVLNHAPDAVLDDDQVLEFTQIHRRGLIGAVTKQGTEYPTDAKDAKVLLAALADMDRTSLTKKRIVSEEKIAAQSAEQVDALAHQMLKLMREGQKAILPQDIIVAEFTEVDAPVLDDSAMPALQIEEGEMEVGIQTQSFEDFRKNYEARYGKSKRREE